MLSLFTRMSEDFSLLFVLNIWSIGFLEKVWVLLSCSLHQTFRKQKTSMTESIFNKVGSCCFTIYRFHCNCLMLKVCWNFDIGVQKNILFFIPFCMKSIQEISFLFYVLEAFNFHILWVQSALSKKIVHYTIITIAQFSVFFSYYHIYMKMC